MPPRALALLPAAFFAVAAAVYLVEGTPENLVWVCNVCNLLLAGSLAAAWPRGIFLSAAWLLLGLPLWIVDAALTSSLQAHSFLTHVAAGAVGLFAIRRLPVPRGLWWQAVLFGIACQLLARAITPPAANVNVAFTTYHSLQRLVPGVAAGWLVNIAAFAVAFLAVEHALRRLRRGGGSVRASLSSYPRQ